MRAFSDELRLLLDREFAGTGPLFPSPTDPKPITESFLKQSVFADFKLTIDRVRSQKWLALGLYWLMSPGKVARGGDIERVVTQEPEMELANRGRLSRNPSPAVPFSRPWGHLQRFP